MQLSSCFWHNSLHSTEGPAQPHPRPEISLCLGHTRQRAQTPAQGQGAPNPDPALPAAGLISQDWLWKFSTGPSNTRGKQILGAACPGQGTHITVGWTRPPNSGHGPPKEIPHTIWEGLHPALHTDDTMIIIKLHIYAWSQEQEILPPLLHPDLHMQGNLQKNFRNHLEKVWPCCSLQPGREGRVAGKEESRVLLLCPIHILLRKKKKLQSLPNT